MASQKIFPPHEVDRDEVHWRGAPKSRRMTSKSIANHRFNETTADNPLYRNSHKAEGEYSPGLVNEFTAWDVYNNEAKKVDDELIKDWTVSLKFLLVFAAIFSAVLTAFVIESIKLLQQDPMDVLLDLMIFYTNNLANGTHTLYPRQTFEPTSTSIYINCLFFASLSISLVAALASVVALQWVAKYDAVVTRGGSSPADRAKRRQFRYSGVRRWKMGEIIAALPLLLYSSLCLFFSGLIVWMWDIHHTVACVVASGAAMAVFFYLSSTTVAIFYVSAPFRAPLSSWIYTLGKLSMLPLARTFQCVGADSVSTWMYKKYDAYTLVHKRLDRAVELDPHLAQDALVWLAGRVSISSDSHKRLLLLVSELPALSKAGLLTSKFTGRTWSTILDLLGWHYLQNSDTLQPTSDYMRGMSILTQCAKTPEIARIIQPTPDSCYHTDGTTSHYWKQYCIMENGTIANPGLNVAAPNSLFLLTRDLPAPLPHSSAEIEATIRLSKWRNSEDKPPAVWQDVFSHLEQYSPGFFDSCVRLFGNYTAVSPWFFGDNEHNVYIAIFGIILSREKARVMSSEALYALIHAFESLVEGKKIRKVVEASPCLYHPLFYGQRIQEMAPAVKGIHHSLVLLLARSIGTCSKVEIVQRFYEVIGMVWLRPSSATKHDWDQLRRVHGEDCSLVELRENALSGWIHNVDEVPGIREIFMHLSGAQATVSNIDPLWRENVQETDKGHLIEALEVFDRVLISECTLPQHLAIIDILCRNMKALRLWDSGSTREAHALKCAIGRIRDPCLRIIGCRALKIDISSEDIPSEQYIDTWQVSWRRTKEYIFDDLSHEVLSSFWHLRALLWQSTAQTQKMAICMEAWKSPEKLSQLGRIFDPGVGFTGNNDGAAVLLQHLHVARAGMVILRDKSPRVNGIPLKDRQLYPVLALLALSDIEDVRSLILPETLDRECIMKVWELCKSVKLQQSPLLSLVVEMATHQAKNWTNYPEDVASLLYVVTKSITWNDEETSTPLLRLVVRSLCALRDAMMETGRGDVAERELVSAQTSEVVYLLLEKLSKRQEITGRCNLRALSCARTAGQQAAIGWLPMLE